MAIVDNVFRHYKMQIIPIIFVININIIKFIIIIMALISLL